MIICECLRPRVCVCVGGVFIYLFGSFLKCMHLCNYVLECLYANLEKIPPPQEKIISPFYQRILPLKFDD